MSIKDFILSVAGSFVGLRDLPEITPELQKEINSRFYKSDYISKSELGMFLIVLAMNDIDKMEAK
jgi:hypothetical protein